MLFITQITRYIFLTLSLLFMPAGNKNIELEIIHVNTKKVEFFTARPEKNSHIIYKGGGKDKKRLCKISKNIKNNLIFNIYDNSFNILEQIDLSVLKNNVLKGQRNINIQFPCKNYVSQIEIKINPGKKCLYLFMFNKNSKQKVIVRIKGDYSNYKIPANLIKANNVIHKIACQNMNIEFRLAQDEFQQGLEKKITDDKKILFLYKDVLLSGKHVKVIYLRPNIYGGINIALNFNKEGSKKFFNITKKNKGKKLALIVKGRLLTAPVIMEPVSNGKVEISAGYTVKKVKEIFNNICNEE